MGFQNMVSGNSLEPGTPRIKLVEGVEVRGYGEHINFDMFDDPVMVVRAAGVFPVTFSTRQPDGSYVDEVRQSRDGELTILNRLHALKRLFEVVEVVSEVAFIVTPRSKIAIGGDRTVWKLDVQIDGQAVAKYNEMKSR